VPEPGARPVRIFLADDHAIFRDGLRRLLEGEPDFTVVGEAADGYQALKLLDDLRPDILLLDLAMRPPGAETLRHLGSRSNPVRAIVLTASIEPAEILDVMLLGARGVVLKESATALLMKCIRTVLAGEYWVGNQALPDLVTVVQRVGGSNGRPQRRFGLTPREYQVITTIMAGFSNKEIAERFSISEDTVKHHLTNIFDKLGVSTRLELATFTLTHHLLDG
jgi:two-component system nitrate/nitrite response regulator NarL